MWEGHPWCGKFTESIRAPGEKGRPRKMNPSGKDSAQAITRARILLKTDEVWTRCGRVSAGWPVNGAPMAELALLCLAPVRLPPLGVGAPGADGRRQVPVPGCWVLLTVMYVPNRHEPWWTAAACREIMPTVMKALISKAIRVTAIVVPVTLLLLLS